MAPTPLPGWTPAAVALPADGQLIDVLFFDRDVTERVVYRHPLWWLCPDYYLKPVQRPVLAWRPHAGSPVSGFPPSRPSPSPPDRRSARKGA